MPVVSCDLFLSVEAEIVICSRVIFSCSVIEIPCYFFDVTPVLSFRPLGTGGWFDAGARSRAHIEAAVDVESIDLFYKLTDILEQFKFIGRSFRARAE